MKKTVKAIGISALVWMAVKQFYRLICWFLEGCADKLNDLADWIRFEWLADTSQKIAHWIDSVSYMSDEVGTIAAVSFLLFLVFKK
ncbi:MAG: hypothetical protein F6K19_14670 [Cyanothece sp. SIO1E1]|nr:hypothetical protein [Cyanothece sp. SIO1E1]